MPNGNIKLAVQKKGRLTDKSLDLLRSCGLDIESYRDRLLVSAKNFSMDILFLRDDDIPEYVQDGVADIGILGENVAVEKNADVKIVKKLGFSKCKLMIAVPEAETETPSLEGKTIATSYPNILGKYLKENEITAKVIEISGSVEIAPSLGIADYICDIVSTGTTLKMNKLKKSFTIFNSEAVLISGNNLSEEKQAALDELVKRIESSIAAKNSKYLMMNVPEDSLKEIIEKIPSLKSPTVLPLAEEGLLAVHAVIPTETFWKIVDDLKALGASGILLLPIENMIL